MREIISRSQPFCVWITDQISLNLNTIPGNSNQIFNANEHQSRRCQRWMHAKNTNVAFRLFFIRARGVRDWNLCEYLSKSLYSDSDCWHARIHWTAWAAIWQNKFDNAKQQIFHKYNGKNGGECDPVKRLVVWRLHWTRTAKNKNGKTQHTAHTHTTHNMCAWCSH